MFLLSRAVEAQWESLAKEFAIAKPFRQAVIDDFLDSEFAGRLLREFPDIKDPSRLVNEFGDPNPKGTTESVAAIGDSYRQLDQFLQTREFLSRIEDLTGIKGLKFDPSYFGGGAHEEFNGAGTDPHYDFNFHPKTGQHHRLTLVLYLNKSWDPAWGGAIRFHRDAWDLGNDDIWEVEPRFNRCVILETTENSWYSVTTVRAPAHDPLKSRKTFLIYLYTDERPADETAPSHGTVYVQGGMPKAFTPGAIVTPDLHDEISANIGRRHSYLRQLYRREYQFSTAISTLERQLAEWKSASSVPVSGSVILRSVEEPRFPDGWLGRSLKCLVEMTAPIRRVTVHGYCPENAVHGRAVSIALGNARAARVVRPGSFELILVLGLRPAGDATLEITAHAERSSNPDDLRELSVVLTKVVFE